MWGQRSAGDSERLIIFAVYAYINTPLLLMSNKLSLLFLKYCRGDGTTEHRSIHLLQCNKSRRCTTLIGIKKTRIQERVCSS